jgi:hypothetical protein
VSSHWHKLVISRKAWSVLLDYYAERMGADAAARFMDAHFWKADPLAGVSRSRK